MQNPAKRCIFVANKNNKRMSKRKVLGIGETVYDIIFRNGQPSAAVPGGSTFNAMISLGRSLGLQGTEIGMVTETGDDHIGQIITSFMRENHVSTDYVTINRGTQSHISLAFLNDRNDAQYEFYKDHAHASLKRERLTDLSVHADDAVLFGSFFAINPVLRDLTLPLLQAAHDAGAILYYDINFRQSHVADLPFVLDNLEENLSLATVVRGSTEDFGFLYGTSDPEDIYHKHIGSRCKLFICTDGSRPITLITPNYTAKYEVKQVKTVSTIGAGDNFNAGFVYGIMQQGITREQLLEGLSPDQWATIINGAQRFSCNVCQSIYNYIDVDFGKSQNR